MNIENLSKIGLTLGEIKVYLALIKFGAQTKSHLASKAGVSSSKVYEITEKLIKKGLVGSFIKNNIKYYIPNHPSLLKKYIEEKEKEIQKEKKIVEDILPRLISLKLAGEKEISFELQEGWEGIQNAVWQALEQTPKRTNIYGIGIKFPETSFIPKFFRKIREKKIKLKIILTEKPKEKIKYKGIEVRCLKGISKMGLGLYPDRVLIQAIDGEPISLIIKHPKIVESFRHIYNFLWRQAK